jgi:signal transduction histidine kinase
LAALVICAFVGVCAIFFFVKPLADSAICDFYAARPTLAAREASSLIGDLQREVLEKGLSSKDANAISDWVRRNPLLILLIYKNNILIYDSTTLASSILHTHMNEHVPITHQAVRVLQMADGAASVSLSVFPEHAAIDRFEIALLAVCALIFIGAVLIGVRGKVLALTRLEQEVLAIAGGELSLPITRSGTDEIAMLAECVDEMRNALNARVAQEETRQREQRELTVTLAHDLRTPLTALTGYLAVISRSGGLNSESSALLDKCAAKAAQVKTMSNLMFACFTPNALPQEELAETPIESVYGEMAERIASLERVGFICRWGDKPGSGSVAAQRLALMRVLDNVFSNIERYAEPSVPLSVSSQAENGRFRLILRSGARLKPGNLGSGLGHIICENLMSNMGGLFFAREIENGFVYELDWMLH